MIQEETILETNLLSVVANPDRQHIWFVIELANYTNWFFHVESHFALDDTSVPIVIHIMTKESFISLSATR
jgi:hypothetical protein